MTAKEAPSLADDTWLRSRMQAYIEHAGLTSKEGDGGNIWDRQSMAGWISIRSLKADSTLACWCATRDARLLEGEVEDVEGACHGDAVFTVWLGLERLGWVWAVGDPQQDLRAFNAAHAGLYEACFRQPLEWGGR